MPTKPSHYGLIAGLTGALIIGFVGITTQWLRANLHAESAIAEAERASRSAEMAENAKERTEQYLYVAHMNLAQQAYELADPQRVIEILDHHRSSTIDSSDRRSFEWFYWWRQAQQWSKSLDHSAPLNAVSISPDGSTVATAAVDGAITLWGTVSGKRERVLVGHEGQVFATAFSPSDPNLLVSSGDDRTIRFWDASSGVETIKLDVNRSVFSLAFSLDGSTLASGSADQTVGLWDVESGTAITALRGHTDRVRDVVFSPDGRSLVSAGHDRSIRLWDMTAESKPLEVPIRKTDRRETHFFERMQLPNSGYPKDVFKGHAGSVTSLAWSRNGKTLVSGSVDQTARLWNVSDLERRSVLSGHQQTVNALAISKDGRTLASGSDDKTIKLWDIATGEPKTTFEGHKYRVWSLGFTPDSQQLLSASLLIRIWHAPRD